MPGAPTLADLEALTDAELAEQGNAPLTRADLARALGMPEPVMVPGKRTVSDLFRDAIHADAPIPALLSTAAQLTPLGDVAAGAKVGANDLGGTMALLAGQERVAQDFAREGQRIEDDAARVSAINPASPEWAARMLRGASRSLTATAPGAVLGGAPGAIAMGMVQGGASKYLERRELGEDERSALYAALRQFGYEGLPAALMQRFGLGGAETVLADAFRRGGTTALREIIKDGAKAGLHEIPEELTTTGAELGDAAATTDQNVTGADVKQALIDTAGQAFLAPNLVTPARVLQAAAAQREAERSASDAQALAAIRAEQERALAHVPEGGDPSATIKAGAPNLDTGERDAMRSALVAAGRETPPGLDPAHAIPDDSPMAPTDPLLNFDPEQIGKLARADMMTPPTVELSQAATGPVDAVSDPEVTGDTVPVSDASDFGRFLAERGITPEQHAGMSNQQADLVPFVPGDEQTVIVGPSKIAGQGIIAQAQMDPGAGIVAMTSEGKRTPAGRYVNHAARPNARAVLTARGLELVPTRAIAPGEELTISYRQARGPAMELGQRIAADPARIQPAAPAAPAPAPVQPAEDTVARHRKLTAELARWQDKEALARGEGKAGSGRAANARKNAKGVQKLIDGLEGRMAPAELAQVRPQVVPEPAPVPVQAAQPATKAPATAAAAPPQAAPRQIEQEPPQRASTAAPARPSQPAATPVVAAKPAADPATDLEGARAEVARLEAEQAKHDINSPEWAVVDDQLSSAISRRDAAEKAADPIGFRVRRLEANASRFRTQLEKARTEDRQHLQDQLNRIEQDLAEIRDERAAQDRAPTERPGGSPQEREQELVQRIGKAEDQLRNRNLHASTRRRLERNMPGWKTELDGVRKEISGESKARKDAAAAASQSEAAGLFKPGDKVISTTGTRGEIVADESQPNGMGVRFPNRYEDSGFRTVPLNMSWKADTEAAAALPAKTAPSAEQAAGATAPANVPAIPDGSPALPGPQDTPLGRVMTAPTDPVKLANMTTDQRAQLLADARMLAQVAKPKSKTANKAKLLAKSLERIAQAEADAQAQANPPAVASTPNPNPEDQPHADSLPNDDRRTGGVPERADQAPAASGAVDRGTAGGDNGTERQRTGAEPATGREPGNADRSDRGGRDGVHGAEQGGRSAVPVSDLSEQERARGDTKPAQDERLVALLQRGESVDMRPGDSLSVLVKGYVEDRVPAFSVEGKLVRDEHDAAALFAALRSPYVERLSVLVVDQDGTVRRSAVHSVGSIVGADIPTTLADMEAVTGPLRSGDTVFWSHNHPSGDPKPSREDVAVYRRMETILEQRGAKFRGIVTNGRTFYYFPSGTATPVPRQYDHAKPYEAVRFDDRLPLVVNGPAGAAEVVCLVQTNADAVVLYVLTARARVQAVQVYATAPAPEVVERDVRSHGGVQAILSTGDAGRANELAGTMHAAPTVKDIILTQAEPTSYRVEARFTPGREPMVKDAKGDQLDASALDERVEYGAEPEPTPPAEQAGEDTAVAAEPVQTDAQQEQADDTAMQAPAEPINDLPAAPPAPGGAMSHVADAINAQPTGALGVLSPLVGAVKLANGAVQWWSQPLIERVERQAGEHGQEVARMARAANDRTRQLIGQASSILTPALKLMSGRSSAARAAVRNLRSVEWSADGRYGFARFQELVENADNLERLAPAERAMVEKYRALVDMTGQWAENAQFKVYTGQNPDGTPTWLLFQRTPDGRKFIRRATNELHDLMQRPGSAEFEQLANALADANGMERPKVFQRLREESERAIILRQPLESTRWLRSFPTHIRINGRIVPLLESDPFLAAQHIVRGTAMRVGYVEQFGQDVATAATPSEHPAVKAWVHAGGDPAAFIDLSRSLNGMPVDQSPRLAPGSPEYDLVRTIKVTLGVIRTGLLSKAAIVNVPESLGNTLAFVGGKRWLAAWADLMTQPRVAATEMARMGARTEDVANLMGQEGRKRESLDRIIRDIGGRVTLFHQVNEVNELHAALAGLHFAKDLAAGRTSGIDAERLRLLGFTDAEVVQLMSRTAPPKLLEAVATRMAEATQGSTSLPSERAKAAHNRAWNLLVAFDSYGQMKLNRLARVHRAMLDAVREKNPDKLLNAAKIAAGFYAGTAASGTVALFLAALAMGGASGLRQLWEQGEDHPVDLAGDALRYAMLGGAAASVVNAAGAAADGGDQFAEALTRMSLPVSLVQEIAELANGAGRYRDQDMDEKTVTFLRSHLPISRPIATLAAAIGVAYSDPGREAAMSAYWKWRREHTRMVATYGQDESEDQAHTRFRVAMRRAVTELRAGKDPSTHLAEALSAKSEQPQEKGKPKPLSSVVAAIKARRLLATLRDEERAAVTKEIGPTATAKLEAWDALLSEWAERMKAGGG